VLSETDIIESGALAKQASMICFYVAA
jgi:hypothetical protein